MLYKIELLPTWTKKEMSAFYLFKNPPLLADEIEDSTGAGGAEKSE